MSRNSPNEQQKQESPSTEVWEQGRLGKLLVIHVLRAGWRVQTGLARKEEVPSKRPCRLCTGVLGALL